MIKTIPQLIYCSKETLMEFGWKCSQHLGYDWREKNIREIIRTMGGHIVSEGPSCVFGKNNFDVKESFTLRGFAEDIAHYILHSKAGRIPMQNFHNLEWKMYCEAQWFAVGFLVPKDDLLKKLKKGYGNAELACGYHVMTEFVEERLKSLALEK